jgi:hypothetical protein
MPMETKGSGFFTIIHLDEKFYFNGWFNDLCLDNFAVGLIRKKLAKRGTPLAVKP